MTVPQPTAPLPNLPLLRKILDHIDAHPEEWEQTAYAIETECGTAFCIAGHAVAMTEGIKANSYGNPSPASGRDWETAACEHLGITNAESDMFDEWNDRQMIQGYAEAIAARAGEEL